MWELDVSLDEGKTWTTMKKGPSADSCKNYAREEIHRGRGCDAYYVLNTKAMYRLYAGNGAQLHMISFNNRCWRMKWENGNLRPREEQSSYNTKWLRVTYLEEEKNE